MQYKAAALVAVGLASQATATGWLDYDAFSAPSNYDNRCTEPQKGGYDWSGLDTGSFDSYGSNHFSGWSCGNSFGKRDLLTKRHFQSKCIQGNLDEQPSFRCDNEDDRMSIDEMEVSTSEDTDVECEYGMPDGSICRQTHRCTFGGNIIKNTQCGGAKSVTFKPGFGAKPGCSVGVHHVGFDCNPHSPPPPPEYPVPTTSAPADCYGWDCDATSSESVAIPTSSAPAPPCYGEDCGSSAVPSSPATTSESYAVPSSSAPAPPCYGEHCESSATPSPPATTSAPAPSCAYGEDCESSAVPSSSAPTPSCAYGEDCDESSAIPSSPATTSESVVVPSSSAPASSSCVYGEEGCEGPSSAPATTGTPGYTSKSSSTEGSPVGSTSFAGIPSYGVSTSSKPASPATSSKPWYPISSSTKKIPGCGTGTGSPSSSTEYSPIGSSSVPSYPEPSCPGILPKCLKTWLSLSDCKDTSDSDCFCKNKELIKNVHECLPAWAVSNEEASDAASYLMGLCAPHVPENPGIITYCPSTVTPGPTPSYSKPASSAPVESAPVESAPVESAPVESAPVSSAPVYEPSSKPVYEPSTTSSTEGSPVESEVPPPAYTPKESTYWSTDVITITSCGPEVTDCPAGSTVVQTTSKPIVSVETTPATTPYSPITKSEGEAPPAYTESAGEPSSPAEPETPASASTPYSPITKSEGEAPPAYTSPASPETPETTAPAGSAPGYTQPPAAQTPPVTTVTFSSTVEVPKTYTEGPSQGYEIPDESSTTTLVTTITVPKVQITTLTLTDAQGQETTSVGLGNGSPATASATPTADAVGGETPPAYGTGSQGWGTSYVPKPTQSAPLQQYGNSGSKTGFSFAGLAAGAVAVVMAL